jgi:bifunctional non-homologous end joining protein LigD
VVACHDDDGRLVYCGKVGSGLTDDERRRLTSELQARAVATSPVEVGMPDRFDRPVHHVRPELVVEVAFGEWTTEGVLRHPSYLGQRHDVDATSVPREPFPGEV